MKQIQIFLLLLSCQLDYFGWVMEKLHEHLESSFLYPINKSINADEKVILNIIIK